MNFRIRKRQVLVLAIASAQAICLCWGVFVFNSWLRDSVRKVVHDQVLADNIQTAKQMMTLIREFEISDLRENHESWLKLQSTIRKIRLPNEGFVCVVDAGDGQLLCHPALKQAPQALLKSLSRQRSGEAAKVTGKPPMQKAPLAMAKETDALANNDPSNLKREEVRGYTIGAGEHLEIVGAGYMPELEATVNVHQRGSGIENNISEIMAPVLPIGITIAFALVVATSLVIWEILRHYDNRLTRINENLEHLVDERTKALKETRDAVIFGLAKLAESRDTDTGEHLDRIRIYVSILASRLSQTDSNITPKYIENLALASSLHDIGKVAIPDNILLKPGRFEPDERAIMETHAERGGECLQAIGERLGQNDFLQLSREIAFAHHEKWDGTGYPFQVSGENIPLAARIVALADVYDALRSRRPYKEPMSHAKAKEIILEGQGSHFDPQVVEAFLACETEFQSVSDRYANNSTTDSSINTAELQLSLSGV